MPDLIDSPKQQSPNSIRKDIQGLRAVAVVLVILFHLGLPVPGGFIGVDVFFVISGYVITAMLEREWVNSGRISIRRFFVRRFWRLTPALATVVSTTMVFGAATLSPFGPQKLMALSGIGAMLLSANAVIAKFTGGYFDLAANTNPLLNTWSLSVEEQFYVGFLFVLVLGWSLGKLLKQSKATVRVLVASTFIISFVIVMLTQPGHSLDNSNWFFQFYSPLNRAWEFAAGSLLALFSSQVDRVPSLVKKCSGIFGLAVVIFSAFYISQAQAWPSTFTVLPVIGTVLLIASAPTPGTATYKILANKWAIYLGDRSYSLYLWHWPIIVVLGYFALNEFVSIALTLLIATGLTVATYRWVETPLRHYRSNEKILSGILAFGIFATPMVCALGVYEANTNYFWNDSVRSQAVSLAQVNVAHKNGCDTQVSNLLARKPNCSWNLDSSGAPIYLVGDSNASHFSDGLIEAAKQTGHPLITAIGAGCPILFAPYTQPDRVIAAGGKYSNCSKFSQETFAWLKKQPKGLVVLSNTDLYVHVPDLKVVSSNPTGMVSGNQYFQLLTQSLVSLKNEGFKVAVISGSIHFDPRMKNFPSQYKWEPSRCTLVSEIFKKCAVSMPISAVQKYQSDYWHSLREAASSSGSSLIDLSLVFCNNKYCPTQTKDLQIYRDGGHITVQADMTLVPRFVREINKIFKVK